MFRELLKGFSSITLRIKILNCVLLQCLCCVFCFCLQCQVQRLLGEMHQGSFNPAFVVWLKEKVQKGRSHTFCLCDRRALLELMNVICPISSSPDLLRKGLFNFLQEAMEYQGRTKRLGQFNSQCHYVDGHLNCGVFSHFRKIENRICYLFQSIMMPSAKLPFSKNLMYKI